MQMDVNGKQQSMYKKPGKEKKKKKRCTAKAPSPRLRSESHNMLLERVVIILEVKEEVEKGGDV